MKTIYLVQAQFSYTHNGVTQYWFPYTAGSLWAYAKEKVDDWVLGEIIYKRESIDELVSRIETVDLVAFVITFGIRIQHETCKGNQTQVS